MDKNELLKRSREQKEDEGAVYAENKGRRYGVIAFCSFFILILLFDFFNGQSIHVPMSLFWTYMSAEAYGKYKITKNHALLITTIAGAIAAFAFLARHVIEILGILV